MRDKFEKVLMCAELVIMKRDFYLLRRIMTRLSSLTNLQVIPYCALLCYESIEYLKTKGVEVKIKQTSKYEINDVIRKGMFFDSDIKRILKNIMIVDKAQNDYYISDMKCPELGTWNLHNNIALYFDSNKNIIGNTHQINYIFLDETILGNPLSKEGELTVSSKEARAFGFDLGVIIGSITSSSKTVSNLVEADFDMNGVVSDLVEDDYNIKEILGDFIEADFDMKDIEIKAQNFNTNRCLVSAKGDFKAIRLFLLHILSSIGIILYVIKRSITRENGLLLRIEYIIYNQVLLHLEGLARYIESSDEKVEDQRLLTMLKSIDYSNNGLRITEFGECMKTFNLFGVNGKPLIEEDKFDLSVPFCGLIESHFDMDYAKYKSLIEEQLISIYDKLNKYLDFELLLIDNDEKV